MGRVRTLYERFLRAYHARPRAILVVLITIAALNVADLLLTVRALRRGAVEANPVMAWLFSIDPVVGAGYKLAAGGLVVLAIFAFRRYRRVLEASIVLVTSFLALLGYHLVGAFAWAV